LAQTPDINETFLREVDENLRRDRLRDLFRDNLSLIIAAVVLFLAVAGGLIWWQQHKVDLAAQHGEQLSSIYRDIASGNVTTAPKQLDELSKSSSKAIRASAEFTSAAVDVQKDDNKSALEKYRALASDDSLPQAYRDAALVRQTAMEFDQLKPEEVIARLQPLASPGKAWFGSAGEMTGLALIKQGKNAEAGRLFASIAKDKDVPQTLRDRAVQIAGSLGVDASSALAPQAQ
jgi:hypothetical protein